MDVRVTEMYNRSVLYDRIRVCKINQEGLFTLIDEDGHRIIGSFETVTSIQIDEELPPDCHNCPATGGWVKENEY